MGSNYTEVKITFVPLLESLAIIMSQFVLYVNFFNFRLFLYAISTPP